MSLVGSTVAKAATFGRLCPCEKVVRRWQDRGSGIGGMICRFLHHSQSRGVLCSGETAGILSAVIVDGTEGSWT